MNEQQKKPRTAAKAERPARREAPRKKGRGINLSKIIAMFIIFLAFYALGSLIITGFVYYSFYTTSGNDDIYSIDIYYDENKLHSLDSEDVNNEYGLYIPFEYLAEIGSFGMAGEGDEMTLFLIGTENRIKCKKNSSLVLINDNSLRISAPVLYQNDDFLIPVSLLENYIIGVDVSYDEENMVCSISSEDKNDISFKLLLPDAMDAPYFPDSVKYYGTDTSDISE